MSSPMESQAFLFIWIGFLLLMSGGIGVFFIWGIRSGQFGNQERARYLPLQSGIQNSRPEPPSPEAEAPPPDLPPPGGGAEDDGRPA